MAVPILTTFPQSIASGVTTRLQLSFGDYPSGTWTAELRLNNPDAPSQSITGTPAGDGFLFIITAAISAAMIPGRWLAAVRVTSGDDVADAQAWTFTVTPNIGAIIEKSEAEQSLVQAWATYRAILASPHSTGSWNGQSWSQANLTELFNNIQRLRAIVEQERAELAGATCNPPTRSIRPYFV